MDHICTSKELGGKSTKEETDIACAFYGFGKAFDSGVRHGCCARYLWPFSVYMDGVMKEIKM